MVVGAFAILVTLLAFSERVYATLISSATATFFVTMGFAVIGLLFRMLFKKWQSGAFTLAYMTLPAVIGAVCWIVFEFANSLWPREVAGQSWYVSSAVFIGMLVAGNVRGALDTISKNEEFINLTLAVLMTPE